MRQRSREGVPASLPWPCWIMEYAMADEAAAV